MASNGPHLAGSLLRRARLRAGISQRELARRLGTSQSLVARWEAGAVEPGFDTVIRATRACGFELEYRVATYDREHDVLVSDNVKLSPVERLEKMERWRRESARLRGRAARR